MRRSDNRLPARLQCTYPQFPHRLRSFSSIGVTQLSQCSLFTDIVAGKLSVGWRKTAGSPPHILSAQPFLIVSPQISGAQSSFTCTSEGWALGLRNRTLARFRPLSSSLHAITWAELMFDKSRALTENPSNSPCQAIGRLDNGTSRRRRPTFHRDALRTWNWQVLLIGLPGL